MPTRARVVSDAASHRTPRGSSDHDRRRRSRSALIAAAAVAAVALVLTGCTTTTSDGSTANATATQGYPITIPNTFGTTTISSQPKRVATTSWDNQDVALALGVVPVAMPKATYGDDNGDGVLPWTADALKKLGATTPQLDDETDGIPYEKIAGAQPDVILGGYSGLTQQQYSTLSQIAPTVSYPTTAFGTPWRQTTLVDGKALGKEAQAKALVTRTNHGIAAETAKYPQLKGKTVMYLWVDPKNPGTITYYTTNDARVKFLNDLGLKTAPVIQQLSKGSSQFFGTISSEKANTLDADIAVIYVDDAGSYSTIENNPLLSQIPAVKRGSVALLSDTTEIMATSAPTVLSIPWVLPRFVPLLAAAADKSE